MNKLPIAPEYLLYLIVLLIGITIFTLHVLKSKKIYEKFRESNNKPIFYMFYAEWCGHSKKMLPEWTKLIDKYDTSIDFKLINCEMNKENRNLCKKYKIRYLPTLIFLKQDGTHELYNGGPDINNLVAFTEKQMKQ